MANKYEYNIPEGYEARIEGNKVILEPKDSEDERIRKDLVDVIKWLIGNPHLLSSYYADRYPEMLDWLARHKDENIPMIQWTGDNLKEVIEFTGRSPRFEEWFNSWSEYVSYVREHDNIFKLFNEDGSHYEIPVGGWIVKTPDGYNVASQATFVEKQKKVYKPSNTQMYILNWVANILLNREGTVDVEAAKILQTLYDELKKL